MNYINGQMLKELREKQSLTQKDLADILMVSDKTISKWENSKGFPDVGILEELAKALGVSVAELLMGEYKVNDNVSANMKKMHFYVCPICGNVITSIGVGTYSCCGITLPDLEAESSDEKHDIIVETVDNEYHITMDHVMKKNHYISFIAYVTSDHAEVVKLYPEQDISVRLRKKGHGILYAFCNRHGMYQKRI